KAMVDAGSYFVGDTIVLTAGQDTETGTGGDDIFSANQNTLGSDDNLDGGAGNDALELTLSGGGNYAAAPTLTSIEKITVKGSSVFNGSFTLDLSNSDGINTLESFQTTGTGELSFVDIQNVNGTDIRIIDTSIDHNFSYDTNAYQTRDG